MKVRSLTLTLPFLVSLISLKSLGQGDFDINEYIESYFPQQEEDLNYEDLYFELYDRFLHPLDLNSVTFEELEQLKILTSEEISAIISHREATGKYLSKYELQVFLDLSTINRLKPFVVVANGYDAASVWEKIKTQKVSYFVLRQQQTLEKPRGYVTDNDSRYLGSKNKLFGTVRSQIPDKFSFGLTFEKDAGERLIWDPPNKQLYFDFVSSHLMIEPNGLLEKLLIGDFKIQTGQGLVMGAGFFSGKTSEPILSTKKNDLGIRPYSSALESRFLRGATATFHIGNTRVTPFIAKNYVDSNIDTLFEGDSLTSGLVNISAATSLIETGFHRNVAELSKRYTNSISNIGATVSFVSGSKNFNFGMVAVRQKLETPLFSPLRVYNKYRFRGTEHTNLGLNFNYHFQNFNFFGEHALSSNDGSATVIGMIASLGKKIDFASIHRNFGRAYHSFYSNAFSESTNIDNEIGTYWGLKVYPKKGTTLSMYFDRFQFPSPSFRAYTPTSGFEYMIRLDHKLTSHLKAYFQLRNKTKGENDTKNESPENRIRNKTRINYVFNLKYEVEKSLEIQSRLMGSKVNFLNDNTYGVALMQDISYKFKKLSISARYAIFETDDYDTRLYAYEKAPAHSISIPAYNGKGVRTYLLTKYKLTRNTQLWIKYGTYQYIDQEAIGSGNELIEGTRKRELSLQIKCAF